VVNLTDLEAVSGLEFFLLLFESFYENVLDDRPITKSIADAITNEIHEMGEVVVEGRSSNYHINLLVALTNGPSSSKGLSKGRRKKIKQVLRDNSRIPFQHIYAGIMMTVISCFVFNIYNLLLLLLCFSRFDSDNS